MQKLKLLIIDTDDMTELLVREFLGEQFEYQVCRNPSHVLVQIAAFKPDLLICDAITPGEDMREVCIQISRLIPIIMLSSMNRNEERRTCYLEHTHSYLTKPYSQDDLIQSVNSALKQSNKYAWVIN